MTEFDTGDRVVILVQRDDIDPCEAKPGDFGTVRRVGYSNDPVYVVTDRTSLEFYFEKRELGLITSDGAIRCDAGAMTARSAATEADASAVIAMTTIEHRFLSGDTHVTVTHDDRGTRLSIDGDDNYGSVVMTADDVDALVEMLRNRLAGPAPRP